MPSPFPGMDPYLESPEIWRDCHLTLVIAMRAQLNAVLPKNYFAAADRYVWIHEPEAEERTRVVAPDVYVVDRGEASATKSMAASGASPATATVVLPVIQREGNKFLKIIDSKSRRLVTVIELLSPSNKRVGPDREAYLSKRIDYLTAGVNVVEIDLLRGGVRLPLGQPFPESSHYYILVARAAQWPNADAWFFSVREPFPIVPVPLLSGDADCSLNLRECLDRAFEEGRYAEELVYNLPPDPPLNSTDSDWANALLRSA